MDHSGTGRRSMGRRMTAQSLHLIVALLAGLAFAAALMEAVGLITFETVGFDLFFQAPRHAWRALPFILFAGPMLLIRLARQRAEAEGWAVRPLAAVTLSLAWALASGHLLLTIAAWATAHWPGGAQLLAQAG